MPKLIDADKMIKDIKENYVIYGYADFLNDFFRMVEEQPLVDAVEVVRCKDCKHYKGLAECDVIGECMGTDGYCAWGERREDAKTH